MGAPRFSETLSLSVASGASQEPATETAVPQVSSSGSLVVMYFTTIPGAAPEMTWGQVRQELTDPHFIEEKAQVTNSVPTFHPRARAERPDSLLSSVILFPFKSISSALLFVALYI